VRAQVERDLAPLERRALDLVHAVDLPLLVARLLDMPLVDHAAGPVLEAADRFLEPRDLLLLGHVRLLLPLQLELARHGVRGIVARPHPDAAARELGDLADRLVEQVAVVRDRDDGTFEGAHQQLHPLARLDVEVRFGLVEQEHVGVAQQARGESDQLALPAGEHARRLREVLVVEAHVAEQRAGAALEARPARGGPALQEVLLALQQPRHPVEVTARLAERGFDRRELALELVEVRPRCAQRVQCVPRVALELLRQECEHEPPPLRHLSRIGLLEAGKDAEERRLAAPVRPDHAQTHARLDVQVEPVEDQPRAEALRNAACLEERHAPRLDDGYFALKFAT